MAIAFAANGVLRRKKLRGMRGFFERCSIAKKLIRTAAETPRRESVPTENRLVFAASVRA